MNNVLCSLLAFSFSVSVYSHDVDSEGCYRYVGRMTTSCDNKEHTLKRVKRSAELRCRKHGNDACRIVEVHEGPLAMTGFCIYEVTAVSSACEDMYDPLDTYPEH